MKMKIKIPALFLAALLALSAFAGCNDLPPAENPSNSASAESSPLTEEELEHLRSIRTVVHDHLAIFDTAGGAGTIQMLDKLRAKREENPDHIIPFESFLEEVASDPGRDEYHSPQIAEQLKKGMFINEVKNILGRPHGLYYFAINDRWSYTNTYTAYVLDDGQVLLLRFIQASIKDYSQEELESRIPNFNEEDWKIKFLWPYKIGWFKLQEVRVLSLEEFQSIDFLKQTITPHEELPDEFFDENGNCILVEQ